ncbi:MAG TPA: SpoIID/LytB domain-containing protein [Gaiellaceae bacterium]|nr:SpoIID/LytB domain-containing protein [Gaiellaceae bacterium]
MSTFASLVRVLAGVTSMRRTVAIASILLLGAVPAAHARAHAKAAAGAATFVVTGHGWGHGVGMSQYGAYGYAQKGYGFAKIVLHYFPGTELGQAPVSKVRVLMTSGVGTLPIGSASDFKVKDATGAVHTVAVGKYTLTPALKLKVDGAATVHALPGPLLFQPGTAPLQLKHLYRGSMQVDVVNGKLRAINVVGLEQYLYGVVPSEMPFSWAPEALKAQAVVARSYALATRRTGAFDLYPDTRSQVYLGIEHEKPSTTEAVDATAGQVVLYQGEVAKTFFFSTSGGRTASAEDVWGEAVPYLVSVPDPYDSVSPHHTWGPMAYTGAGLAKRLKMKGRVMDVQSELNSSGRVKTLTVIGSQGTLEIPGANVRQRLGVQSTWFTVGVLSLSAPTATVVYGSRGQLSGIARGVGNATLQQLDGTTWKDVGAVKADKDGTVTLSMKPTVTTRYRLATGKVSAPSVRVPVAPLVRFYPPRTPDQLSGYVRPLSLAGARVLIQRQQGPGWTTAAQATVAANGAFLAKLQLSDGVYRARVGSGRGYVAGMTPLLQVSNQ